LDTNLRSIDLDSLVSAFPEIPRAELKRIVGITRHQIIEDTFIDVEVIIIKCLGVEEHPTKTDVSMLRENTETYRRIVLTIVSELGIMPTWKQGIENRVYEASS
jgi:hypothetical protein